MAFTLERYVTVDAELQHLQQYLAALAAEIDAVAPATDRHGLTHQVAAHLAEQIELLRCMLADEQEAACKTLVLRRGHSVQTPISTKTCFLPTNQAG